MMAKFNLKRIVSLIPILGVITVGIYGRLFTGNSLMTAWLKTRNFKFQNFNFYAFILHYITPIPTRALTDWWTKCSSLIY